MRVLPVDTLASPKRTTVGDPNRFRRRGNIATTGAASAVAAAWLNARCLIRQETFGGTLGNGQDAPIAAIRATAIEPSASTPDCPLITAPAGGQRIRAQHFVGSQEFPRLCRN